MTSDERSEVTGPDRQPTWQARVREPSLTALLVWLLLLTFGLEGRRPFC